MKNINNLKVGILLIVLGNILYLVYIHFSGKENSNFSDFASGLLIGLSVATNLVGIVLSAIYVRNNKN